MTVVRGFQFVFAYRFLLILFLVSTTLTGCAKKEQLPPVSAGIETPGPNEVFITATGFSPATLTVRKGTTVIWANKDSVSHWIASDPHPTHTNLSGFDAAQAVPAGGQYSFTFTKVGDWAYHDHLRPVTYTGNVLVTEN